MARHKLSLPEREPAAVAASIVAGVTAVIALVVAFGVPLTDEQRTAILGVAAVAAPIIAAALTRPKVTPNAKVDTYVEDGKRVAGEANPVPTGVELDR